MMKIRITNLDKLFSRYIRERAGWKCERCFTQYQQGARGLHCSHFWGRSKKSVRWDLRNLNSMCHGCHSYFTAHPAEHHAWKLKQMGERDFKILEIDAHLAKKPDEKLIEIYIKKLIEELPHPS